MEYVELELGITLLTACDCASTGVHKKCSGIRDRLMEDVSYRCSRCRGLARPIDGRPYKSVLLNEQEIEIVDSFCYLGDTISAGGGCVSSTIVRARARLGEI